jgi:hypothetical protein
MRYLYLLVTILLLNTGTESFAQVRRIIAWDGETAAKGSGWTNPETTCKVGPQSVETHSGKTALEFQFKFKDTTGIWCGAGWDWAAMQVGPYGIDITEMNYLTFWLKVQGKVAEFSFNLLCNGEPALDQPQHHTEKVVVSKYCPEWKDGEWHQVIVPLKDLVQPEGFDARHVAEIQFFNTGAGDGSFLIDDIVFEGLSVNL